MDLCIILYEHRLGFAVIARVDHDHLRLFGHGILHDALDHIDLRVGDPDGHVAQELAVSFFGERPGFARILGGGRQVVNHVVDHGSPHAGVGGTDADRVVSDLVEDRVEGELAGGIQFRDIQVCMRSDHFHFGSRQRGCRHLHDLLVRRSVGPDGEVQRDLLRLTVQDNRNRVFPAVLGADNDIEYIVADRLDRCVVTHFTGVGGNGIAAVHIIDGDPGSGTHNDFDGSHGSGYRRPERFRGLQLNRADGDRDRIYDRIQGGLTAGRRLQEWCQRDVHRFLQRSFQVVVPGMVSDFHGGKPVHHHIAGMQLADIDRSAFLPGDQDGMGSHVIHHGGGHDRVLVDGRLLVGNIVLVSEVSGGTEACEDDQDCQELQETMLFLRPDLGRRGKGTGKVPGTGAFVVPAGKRRIIGPAFGKGTILIHVADPVTVL